MESNQIIEYFESIESLEDMGSVTDVILDILPDDPNEITTEELAEILTSMTLAFSRATGLGLNTCKELIAFILKSEKN